MFLNEAMLKQKTPYDFIVDRIGTEKEYAEDIASYLIDDSIRNSQMLFIALKYIFQNRQLYTATKLIYNVLKSTSLFKSCFQDDVLSSNLSLLAKNKNFDYANVLLKNNVGITEIDEYFVDSLKYLKKKLDKTKEDMADNDDLINYVVYKNGIIKCEFSFNSFDNKHTAFDIVSEFFKTKTENNNVFEYKINNYDDLIEFCDEKNNKVCVITDNSVDLYYSLL